MKRVLIGILALGLTSAYPAKAQGWAQSYSPGQARDALKKGDIIPLRDIFSKLKRDYGGYQLDAELFAVGNGRFEYRVEWMTEDGRRLRLRFDAQSGQLINSVGG